jgi:hypothetical protein
MGALTGNTGLYVSFSPSIMDAHCSYCAYCCVVTTAFRDADLRRHHTWLANAARLGPDPPDLTPQSITKTPMEFRKPSAGELNCPILYECATPQGPVYAECESWQLEPRLYQSDLYDSE